MIEKKNNYHYKNLKLNLFGENNLYKILGSDLGIFLLVCAGVFSILNLGYAISQIVNKDVDKIKSVTLTIDTSEDHVMDL